MANEETLKVIDYIDRFKVLELLKRYADLFAEPPVDRKELELVLEIKFKIERLKSADATEVKRGEWKDRYNNKYYNHLYECSVCGKEALYECYKNELDQWNERQALTPVCPHCGAKMDSQL